MFLLLQLQIPMSNFPLMNAESWKWIFSVNKERLQVNIAFLFCSQAWQPNMNIRWDEKEFLVLPSRSRWAVQTFMNSRSAGVAFINENIFMNANGADVSVSLCLSGRTNMQRKWGRTRRWRRRPAGRRTARGSRKSEIWSLLLKNNNKGNQNSAFKK